MSNKKKKYTYLNQQNHKPKSNLSDMVLTIIMMPFIIAGAIAMMMLSYMIVPLFVVSILGSIIYFVIKANKSQY